MPVDLLIDEALKIIQDVEFNLIKEKDMEKTEYNLILLLAAIKDKQKVLKIEPKVLTLGPRL